MRRQPPAREGPRRARLSEAHDDSAAGASPPSTPAAAPFATPVEPTVAQVVAAAYRVLDDNVDQGHRAAERFRTAVPPPAGSPPNAKAVAGRLLHMTREMGVAWADLFGAALREPEVKAILERITPHDRPRADTTEGLRGAAAITQRIASRKPIEVTLSPLPWSGRPPAIGGLHALDPATPPIRAVLFTLRAGGGLELSIEVPDNQPVGSYFGTVVDGARQQPIGALTVRVLD